MDFNKITYESLNFKLIKTKINYKCFNNNLK